ncbi:WXG100 family type VII secretion target [Mycobacterium sp. PSTR-4-N]|uniref:WXG100 family type VII secretion target n=1 Tax=Mycobacterium sp. PSTR-4-N TaxID=2917745 RepID=UPI001F14C281|nr:WXG100 family type VII secretion target [Mycobacterium sp. PSTR-4-N]MCG7592736.1 WXG100 family type VII secretion target [Mycobacterium sp. PSTR-4-N]
MALYGADIEQVQQLSNQLNAKANDIQGIVSQLSSAISSVNWMGPDADRFRSDWQGQHVAQLKQVISALQTASQNARRNAQEQQTASGA